LETKFFRSESDFTPEAVGRALGVRHPGTKVSEVRILARHQGSASHVTIELTYAANPDGLPKKMFVKTLLDAERDKLPSGYAENLQGDLAIALYAVETKAYEHIVSAVELEAPRVFAAALGVRPGDFYLFLEELTDRNIVCPKVVPALPAERIAKLLGELARLHAAYWLSPKLDGELSWLDTGVVGVGSDFLRQGGWRVVDIELAVPFKAKILDEIGIDPRHVEKAFWARQHSLDAGPDTLLHGDPHPGNIYFLPDGGVGLLDWQLARRGPWTHDVSYAITSALEPDDRRRHERALLADYRQDIQRLGVKSPPSEEAMWLEHRRNPAWGLPMWGITPAAMYSEEEIGGVMRRFGAAWRDFSTSEALGL
jgi:hypothetical protein